MIELNDRFFSKVQINHETGCHEWVASKVNGGYGKFRFNDKIKLAHRLAYEFYFKDPENMCVCHHCDNPSCVNPEHLFLGTQKDNIQDAIKKGRLTNRNQKGELNNNSKLSYDDVVVIKQQLSDGVAQKTIAKQYRVSIMAISFINTGHRWTYV